MENNYLFKFNAERYFYLKTKRAFLAKKNINQKLSKSERFELSKYSEQYFYYLCWQQRLSFLNLIQKFIKDELDGVDFFIEFNLLWKANQKLLASTSLEMLKKVQIDLPSLNFTRLISFSLLIDNLNVSVYLFEMSTDDNDSDEIELKNAVLKYYKIFLASDSAIDVEIELDPLLLEGSSIVEYKDSYVLQETMIFFTLVTGITYTLLNPTLFNLIWK